jgi:hypothetical protein
LKKVCLIAKHNKYFSSNSIIISNAVGLKTHLAKKCHTGNGGGEKLFPGFLIKILAWTLF